MLKITGAILMIAGTTGAGISVVLDMKRRLHHIRCLHHMFTLLYGEITYAKTTIGEACRNVSRKTKSPYCEFLQAVFRQLAENEGSSFEAIWKEAMREYLSALPLKGAEWNVLEAFAGYTGCPDMALQKRLLTYETEDLEKLALQAEEDITKQGKLYVTFGVMSGLLLTVILL